MTVLAEIPLTPVSQTFQVTLANTTYAMAVTWRDPYGWFLDIATPQGVKLVSGLPLVAGIDLLEPYPFLGFGGSLVVLSDGDLTADPTLTSLGVTTHLCFVTP